MTSVGRSLRSSATRADLVEAVYKRVGLSRAESARLVELVFTEITDCLERGESVKLSTFGSFVVRSKGQRMGRNPKTGIEVTIGPRRVVVFKGSDVLRKRLATSKGTTTWRTSGFALPRSAAVQQRLSCSAGGQPRDCVTAPMANMLGEHNSGYESRDQHLVSQIGLGRIKQLLCALLLKSPTFCQRRNRWSMSA